MTSNLKQRTNRKHRKHRQTCEKLVSKKVSRNKAILNKTKTTRKYFRRSFKFYPLNNFAIFAYKDRLTKINLRNSEFFENIIQKTVKVINQTSQCKSKILKRKYSKLMEKKKSFLSIDDYITKQSARCSSQLQRAKYGHSSMKNFKVF